ncbi:unnamed protein product, partial [Adineta steineri]
RYSSVNTSETTMTSATLAFIQNQLNYYGFIIVLIFGVFGNVCIVILFSKRRQNSCSLYLLCGAVMNSVNLIYNSPINIYSVYNWNLPLRFLVFCKLRFYISHAWSQSAKCFIILACIDRFILTSNGAHFRIFNRPLMQRCIIGGVLSFWHIFCIQLLITAMIVNGTCGLFGLYSIVYFAYYVIVISIILPTIMGVYGTLAFRNMRRLHTRVRPMGNSNNECPVVDRIHRADRHLLIMTISEAVVCVVSTSIYPIVYMETALTGFIGINKSPERIQIENFMLNVGSFLLYFNNAAPFYTYLLVSSAFRQHIKQYMMKLASPFTGRPVATMQITIPQVQSYRH